MHTLEQVRGTIEANLAAAERNAIDARDESRQAYHEGRAASFRLILPLLEGINGRPSPEDK